MKKLKLLFTQSKKKQLLLWDNNNEKLFHKAFSSYQWHSLDTNKNFYLAPLFLPYSFYIFFKNFSRLKSCSNVVPKNRKLPLLNKRLISLLIKLKYNFECVCSLSVIFHYDPKLIITNTDNAIYFQYIDSLIHEIIPVITIQNGNRWHTPSLLKNKKIQHFYNQKGFHSCFATLSLIDIDLYKSSRWQCMEYHNLGSLNADYCYNKKEVKNLFDLCIIANSHNDRLSEKQLAKLIKNFIIKNKYKVCVALKLNPSSDNFKRHYEELFNLYGNTVLLKSNNFDSINLMCSSEVILGTFSTGLREVFSLGKKIYPINFDAESLNSYMNPLGINPSPSQEQFNMELKNLLNMPSEKYVAKYKRQMQYIGAFPQSIKPSQRLKKLIDIKLNQHVI